MARLNIDEQFWRDVMKLAVKVGSVDLAIGQAIRFFDLAQQRYKKDRIITDSDFVREEFHRGLIGIFAEEVEGGYMAIGAEKNFGWLRDRVTSGQKGGQKSGESRRSNSKDLQRSKTKQTQANQSNPNPLPLTLPHAQDSFSLESTPGNPPAEPSAALHWLAVLWNEKCGTLAKVQEVNSKRLSSIRARLRECDDRAIWTDTVARIAASDFCNGRVPGKTWRADFDWLIKPGTRIAVGEGKYDNRNARKGATDRDPSKTGNSELDELYRQAGFKGAPDGL